MSFVLNLARAAGIAAVLLKHGAAYLAGVLARRFPLLRLVCRNPLSPPDRLRRVFEELGGTFIKFGQMLALQPDILSIEYCNALFNLLDRVPPFSFDQVRQIIRVELGRDPGEIFDSIDPAPLATASIGQVHIASLNGRKWAVKVQRPRVQQDFAGDIRLMSTAILLIRRLRLQRLKWMIEPMSEFVSWTREELDYRYEARYMHQLRRNASDNLYERVPEVLWELTTRRTLVIEFLEGHTVLAYLRALTRGDDEMLAHLDASGFDSHKVASRIIDNFLGDVFQHGLFHADLHPANLMILPGNVVGYVDFGITGTISAYSRQNLIALTLAYTRGDLEAMAEAFLRVASKDSGSSIRRFRSGLSRAAETWYENDGTQRRLRKNFTLVMLDMLLLSRESGVWPERDVIKYIRSAIAIDGLITRFAPTFDLGAHLGNVCNVYLTWHVRHRLLTFENMLNWATSGGHLMRDGGLRALKALDRYGGNRAAETESDDESRPSPQQAMFFATFLFVTGVATSVSGEPAHLGFNFFTVEAALATGALALLLGSVRKLLRGR